MRQILYCVLVFLSHAALADTGAVPHEYESQGGYSIGLNNGGTVSRTGLGAVRGNPAMLAVEKRYELNASYMWPGQGRQVFQLGAVDSVTSSLALGLLYTGHSKEYKHWNEFSEKEKANAFHDTSLTRRIALGAAFSFSNLAIGVGGQFAEGIKSSKEKTSGLSFNTGAVFTVIPSFRIGASVENLFNSKVEEFAPRLYRIGASYKLMSSLSFNLDYTQRQRVPQENSFADFQSKARGDLLTKDEKTLITSAAITFKDIIILSAGYGRSFDETERNSLAGSLALSIKGLFLSYSLRRPYFSQPHYNHTVHASYHIAL